ncbi:GAF domain-containing protein [bacterium]|nr:GAF domain-containing protein [bacterium]
MRKIDKGIAYRRVISQLDELLPACPDTISAMATIASILHNAFDYFFWTGFYRITNNEGLVIGPYQGTTACLSFPVGRGICGKCAETRKSIIIEDVCKYTDHIICDSRTKSEIVIPVFDCNSVLNAVLDIDSDSLFAFDETDRHYLEAISAFFVRF